MKNLLEYEDYLNESNEVIKAQNACKVTIFQIQKMIDSMFNGFVKEDLVKSYSSKVKPWNDGYELIMDAKVDYLKIKDHENKELIEYVYSLAQNNSISIQPNTWFEKKLEDGDGMAQLEGTALSINGSKSSYAFKHPRYDVKDKKEIDKSAKLFVEHVKQQVADVASEIARLKK